MKNLAYKLMLLCCVIITFAGIPSIDIKTTQMMDKSQLSLGIDWGNAHADNRALHACGDDVVTGEILEHATSHCNIFQWAAVVAALLAAIAGAIALIIGSGGTLLGAGAAAWTALAVAYGGLAALYGLFGLLCNVNRGMCDE